MWRTPLPVAMRLQYGEESRYDQSITESAASIHHEVTLTGLVPGTTYRYRLLQNNIVIATGENLWFRTDAGRGNGSFSFFATGDVGENSASEAFQEHTQARIRSHTPRAEFGLLAGDIVYPDGNSADYDANLMSQWAELLCNTPVWPALGNHDWQSNPDTNFEVEWSLPHNEHYYSFDYGNAHFIALDTKDSVLYDEINQLAWLEQDLATSRSATWTFVYFHHPFLTCTYKGNLPGLAADLRPLLERYRVDMVFTGHAHTYERLFPIAAGGPVNQEQEPHYVDPDGVLYVVSGCGGKYKQGDPTTYCGPTAFFLDEHILFTQAYVRGRTLYLVTWDSLTGAAVDGISVTKSIPTDVSVVPPRARLLQNVPNPFNPATAVPFEIAQATLVQLDIYGPDGRWIVQLAHHLYAPGAHRILWNGLDQGGRPVPSGTYLARLQTGTTAAAIKMTLVR